MVLLFLSDLRGELFTAVVPEEIVSHIQRPLVVATTSTTVLHSTKVELSGALAVSAGQHDLIAMLVVLLSFEA